MKLLEQRIYRFLKTDTAILILMKSKPCVIFISTTELHGPLVRLVYV